MATIKSYTDISQSKKLAEILPLESADMHYVATYASPSEGIVEYRDIPELGYSKPYTSCWSLAALLGVLPYPFLSELSNKIWKCGCYPSGICNYVTADSPVDACYELILKLHELKML